MGDATNGAPAALRDGGTAEGRVAVLLTAEWGLGERRGPGCAWHERVRGTFVHIAADTAEAAAWVRGRRFRWWDPMRPDWVSAAEIAVPDGPAHRIVMQTRDGVVWRDSNAGGRGRIGDLVFPACLPAAADAPLPWPRAPGAAVRAWAGACGG